MKTPISEIVDRYTIFLLKQERGKQDVSEALAAHWDEIKDCKGAIPYVARLLEVNGEIWDLESDIRRGKDKELGLEEVGRRAILIRNLNKKRVSIKNEMTDVFNEGFKDIKVNHGSES